VTPTAVLACITASREKVKEKDIDITPTALKGDTSPLVDASSSLVDDDVTTLAATSASLDDMNISSTAEILPEMRSTVTNSTEVTISGSISLIAAPAPGAVPSFSSVLWGSYQKETHMRGINDMRNFFIF
jgi:hypothetical protein